MGRPRRADRGPRCAHVAARPARPRRPRADRRDRRRRRREGRQARRGRGVPLLRPHLHDGVLPAPDRPAADRPARLPAAGQGRPAGRRPRPPHRRRGPPGRREGRGADRPRRACAARRDAHEGLHHGGGALRLQAAPRRLLAPLLRRPRAQAHGLLRLHAAAHQRRQGPHRLLLLGAQGLLRHVLPDQDPVLSPEAIALVIAGLVAGATGSWSPCGFSMIETLGRRGRATPPACAAFTLGAPLGGVITFGGLAALGALLHGGRAALGVAAAIAIAGAALDAGNVRIVPQIRRQVPEPWRRVLPLPLAAGLYGVLLGMGFTTFVLSFAVPALAAVSVALGNVGLGIALGVAFGLGRALPIVALAPLCEREAGLRAMTAMAERPGLLRAARAGGAAALVLCAVAFAGGAARAATPTVAAGAATDPTVAADGTLGWQVPGGVGRVSRAGALQDLPGSHPAFGGPYLAYVDRDQIVVTDQGDGSSRTILAPGADALAVGPRWLAWRAGGPERLLVLDLADPAAAPRTVTRVPDPATLSRPTLDADVLAYAVAGRTGSTIRSLDLAS